jgi:hypothetical protein
VFLLCACIYARNEGIPCSDLPDWQVLLTRTNTPEFALRIRVKAVAPPGEFDEFDLRHLRVGGIFVVPARLASMLIISGYAEMVEDSPRRAEAADFTRRKRPKAP